MRILKTKINSNRIDICFAMWILFWFVTLRLRLAGSIKKAIVAQTHTHTLACALRSVRAIHVWVCARPCLVVFVVVVVIIVIVVVCSFETHLKFPFRFPHLVVCICVCVFSLCTFRFPARVSSSSRASPAPLNAAPAWVAAYACIICGPFAVGLTWRVVC